MNTREQILSIRKQSGINLSRKGLWFLNENSNVNQLRAFNSSFGGNRLGNDNEAYMRNSLESSEKNRDNPQYSFIVDWQMPDTF